MLSEEAWLKHKEKFKEFFRRKGNPAADDNDICYIADMVASLYEQVIKDLAFSDGALKELGGTLRGEIRKQLWNSGTTKVTESQIEDIFNAHEDVVKMRREIAVNKSREAYLSSTLTGSLPAKRQYIERHKSSIENMIINQ